MATISWIGTTGGDWSDGSNWQGGVVPGASDDAVLNLSNAETVTISSPQLVDNVSFDDPAATFILTGSGNLEASGEVTIDADSVVVNGGISAGDVTIGTNSGGVLASAGVLSEGTPLVAGTLSGGTPPIDILPVATNAVASLGTFVSAGVTFSIDGSTLVPASVSGQPHPIAAVTVASESWGLDSIPYQPVATFAQPHSDPPDVLFPGSFPDDGGSPKFLAPPGGWGGLAFAAHILAAGAPTVTGAGNGAVVTASGFRAEVLAAGAGNETLIAGAGNDTLTAGAGMTRMIGGSGSATFLFTNGEGGTATISNFVHGRDFVAPRDYASGAPANALADAVVVGGSTTITLADNSRVTFTNIANVTSSDFR